MKQILAIYGSPRKNGNTSTLLKYAVDGALETNVNVEELYLVDLKISPCQEHYKCCDGGRCKIEDDFFLLHDKIISSDAFIFSSPVFFYHVTAQFKIFMDRTQPFWIKKYWVNKIHNKEISCHKKTIFISVGAMMDENLFDGLLLSLRNFLDGIDAVLWKTLLFRGVEQLGDILNHPDYLEESRVAGKELALSLCR